MNRETLNQARQAAREKYAWPGGYPLMLLMVDGESICPDCAKREWKLAAYATRHPGHDKQWEVAGVYTHLEGPPVQCAHCNKEIESAYGEDEDEDQTS